MGTMLTWLLYMYHARPSFLIFAIFAIIIIIFAGYLLYMYRESRKDPNHWLTCSTCGKDVYVGPAVVVFVWNSLRLVSDIPDYENNIRYRCSGCSDMQKDM